MSRSEMLELIEGDLSRARDMAGCLDDGVLSYLIDMAISEVQSTNGSHREPKARNSDFSIVMQHPRYNQLRHPNKAS